MKRLLITGFDAFGGEAVNPSLLAAQSLDKKTIGGFSVVAREIPTVFGLSADVVKQAILEIQPEAVLSVGQAGGTSAIKVERFAVNLDDARIADNSGNVPVDVPIAADGPSGYFATLPVKRMVQYVRDAGIPAILSYSAGTFVCNHVFYATSHFVAAERLPVRVGFIHVPYLPEQVVSRPATPSMSLETIVRALASAIEAIA